MTFKEAFEAMKHGAKVKLPSWSGYWFWCIPAQSIHHIAFGQESYHPSFV